MIPHSSTNLKSRVNKLHLPPKTKALLPLFEVISNSIHAIQEKREKVKQGLNGKVYIKTIRNGDETTLKDLSDIETYPINSFEIIDNGIGLNDENMTSFAEFDSEKKAAIGGKGVGRLICLKAFQKIYMESVYLEDGEYKIRKFDYKKSKDGFENYQEGIETNKINTGTKAILSSYESNYAVHVPKEILEIGRQIITHFQLYFIQKIQPEIIVRNQNNDEVNLTALFNREFEKEILEKEFEVANQTFNIFISKSFKSKSHKIHYCAHQRTVRDEGLSYYMNDLKNKIEDDKSGGFYFQIFIISDFLNKNVNEARTSFNFSIEEDTDELDLKEITLSKIRNNSLLCIEELLSDFLVKIREEKMDVYLPIIRDEYPNYSSVIKHNLDKVEKLPAGLSKEELDLKLYEIESGWRIQVKKHGVELLDKKKDITELDDYKELYDKFLTEFNEIGQSDLARYVIHRRSVIDLLDKLIELNDDNEFANEEIVHSLFFPIRETGETITSDKQNMWLLDERLTFNSLLASDKMFNQVEDLNSTSQKRMDLIIRQDEVFENATLLAEEKYPSESFTIVEFKKPERDNYQQGILKHDPVKQIRTYVEDIIEGKKKLKGKNIKANRNTPFYCYIVADITKSLESILDYESFDPTPDGLGYFRFYETKSSRAYIEVLPFQKVIKDAKQRNKVLFDKLNLS